MLFHVSKDLIWGLQKQGLLLLKIKDCGAALEFYAEAKEMAKY